MTFKERLNAVKNFTTKKKEEICASAVMLSAAVIGSQMAIPAITMAAPGGEFEKKVSNALDSVTNVLMNIGAPLYGCIAAICIVIMIAASGPKVQQAKDWLVRATIGFVALLCVKLITDFVRGFAG